MRRNEEYFLMQQTHNAKKGLGVKEQDETRQQTLEEA